MKVVTRFASAVGALMMSLVVGAGTATAVPLPVLPPLPEPFATWLTPPEPIEAKLAKSYATLQKSMKKSLPGQLGIAIVPVGGNQVISLGSLKAGRAWSTLKVPVSLAAQRKRGVAVAAMEDKAITFSDNDAAGELWGALGGGRASVDAVTAVLREGHDTRTHVSSEIDTPASYPGYTSWALRDQALFGAHLPCLPGSEQIIRLMSDVAPNQQWGIAKVGRNKGAVTAVKGGWGPATSKSGGHLVRQLGIITTTDGQVAVSMAAIPRSGSFTDGTKMLTRLGNWLGKNLAELPKGRC
ncbi:hypothetical protein SAMN04488548_1342075 [Gordonia westfalica]|uniref:Beta-lactamase class A n=2 Tax=Gordonia westfalica TaxID=158898 RepID=A0A1H2JGB4_9ACTN|nr:hypothetical protein SAMN04488548_1342075 [Gordonia westfalica]